MIYMRAGRPKCVLAFSFLLTTITPFGHAQTRTELRTWVRDSGSVPPVVPWFDCVYKLNQTHYDQKKAQDCLNSILAHPGMASGVTSFDRHRQLLTFSLTSPTLVVADLDLGVPAEQLAKFHTLLEISERVNGKVLRIGEPYDRERDFQSFFVLDLLSRSLGRRVGISRTVRLDYEKKTAQATYKIWDGPPGVPDQLLPPFSKPCVIYNANFNGFDWDDLTPVDYVRQQMKTKWLGCFSEADLRDDEALLRAMPFLKESKITVTGSGDERDFSFHFRSNPIPIAKVTIHGYGLLDGLSQAGIPPLVIHAGDTFSETHRDEQEKSLHRAFDKSDWRVQVFSDVRITPEGAAVLDFSVLAYPDDVIYVDNQPYVMLSAK